MKEPQEYWIILLGETPDIPGSSNRHFRIEHAPPKPEHFGSRCLSITHVVEVVDSPDNWEKLRE